MFLVVWLSNFTRTGLGFEAFSFFFQFWIFQWFLYPLFICAFFQELWNKFFVFRLGVGNIFFQTVNYDVILSPVFYCLFPSLFLFQPPSPASFQHLWRSFNFIFIQADHCLVSNLFSSSFWIDTLFTSFRFSWSSSICFLDCLDQFITCPDNHFQYFDILSQALEFFWFFCIFFSKFLQAIVIFFLATFNKWKPRSSAAILISQLASFALLGLGTFIP